MALRPRELYFLAPGFDVEDLFENRFERFPLLLLVPLLRLVDPFAFAPFSSTMSSFSCTSSPNL